MTFLLHFIFRFSMKYSCPVLHSTSSYPRSTTLKYESLEKSHKKIESHGQALNLS